MYMYNSYIYTIENATESTTPTDTLIPGQIADISVNVNETTISPGGSTDLFCLVNVKNGGSLASLAWTTFGGSFSVILVSILNIMYMYMYLDVCIVYNTCIHICYSMYMYIVYV